MARRGRCVCTAVNLPGAVALQQPPGDQPGRDGAPGRGDDEPVVRRGHPHAVAVRGGRAGRATVVRGRFGTGAGRARAGRAPGPRRAGAHARRLRALRHPQPRRHRLPEVDRPYVRKTPATMVKTSGYAYPWDVIGDPDFVGRVRDIGVDSVTVAAVYHAAR